MTPTDATQRKAPMTPKITFEEHFMAPGFEKHSEAFLKLIRPKTEETQ